MRIILLLLLALNINVTAQNLNEPLPIDKSVKVGKLPNGLTYYIKSTNIVKNAASYYIIQNVGSLLENEDQRGLAHFLEHMAFNGTKSFPGKGILNTLEKNGAVFGKDINAYTGFDETVYNLNNIPTKDGLVDTCLTILLDWSHNLLLTEAEIDAERAVIKEEWRTRQNGYMRNFEKLMPNTFNKSKYVERMPIGLMDVVENFKYDALRNFYHDWYRTDLQAIAIIGDFDVNDIEKQIIAKFSSIPAVKNPKTRFHVEIPNSKGLTYATAQDPEVANASITYGIRHQNKSAYKTLGDFKKEQLESMVTSMVSERLREKSQDPNAPFLSASFYKNNYFRGIDYFDLNITPKPNMQSEAFKAALTEVVRAVKFGFTPSEIERQKTNVITNFENHIAKINDRSHEDIESEMQQNFLRNRAIVDAIKMYPALVNAILKSITATELHNTIKKLYTKDNRYLNVIAVAGQNNLSETDARAIISDIENDKTLQAYKEALGGKNLMSGINIIPGKITSEVVNDTLNATTFVLSNGIKVHYKFVNKQKDKVSLLGYSFGGKSLVSDADLPSVGAVTELMQLSGLSDYSATDLSKLLTGKTAGVNLSLNETNETIGGNSNTKDVETMLQLVYLNFLKPRFDAEAFSILKNRYNNTLEQKQKDINAIIMDSTRLAVYGKNNPRYNIFDQKYIDAVSMDAIKRVYKERFGNPGDFEFFIIGDVKEDVLKPLLETYLAGLPNLNYSERFKDNQAKWVAPKIKKTIYVAMENPKAVVELFYRTAMEYNSRNSILTNILGDILALRVTESIREAEGGAYSPNAGAFITREPKQRATVYFRFDCNPDMVDKLAGIARGELEKIAAGTILEEDLHKIKTNFVKERIESKDRNDFEMYRLNEYFLYHLDVNDPKNFENIVDQVTVKDIQQTAAAILNGSESYEIITKPKQ